MKINEFRKEVTAPETKEVVKILEGLDKTSIVLAKVYLTALGDRQEIEEREARVDEKIADSSRDREATKVLRAV